MPDFNEVLSKKAAETEKPKPKPVGTYLATVVGMPAQNTRPVNGEDRLIITFKCKAMTPISVEDMAAIGSEGIGDVASWPPFNHDLWVDTPEGEFRFKQFLTEVLKIEPGDKSYGEMLAEAPGKQLTITLIHKPYQDKQTGQPEIATNIGSVAAA